MISLKKIDNSSFNFHIFLYNEKIGNISSSFSEKGTIFISDFYIDIAFRKKGFGNKSFSYFISLMTNNKNVFRLTLNALPISDSTMSRNDLLKFYRKFGFDAFRMKNEMVKMTLVLNKEIINENN